MQLNKVDLDWLVWLYHLVINALAVSIPQDKHLIYLFTPALRYDKFTYGLLGCLYKGISCLHAVYEGRRAFTAI